MPTQNSTCWVRFAFIMRLFSDGVVEADHPNGIDHVLERWGKIACRDCVQVWSQVLTHEAFQSVVRLWGGSPSLLQQLISNACKRKLFEAEGMHESHTFLTTCQQCEVAS